MTGDRVSVNDLGCSWALRCEVSGGVDARCVVYADIPPSFAVVGILRLHREETYLLPPDASPEEIINAELARRTFWIIYCHDDLTSTLNRPSSFSVLDITALLPCAEEDLAFGQHPVARAALVRTGAALADPASPFLPSRSMFASMLQTQSLWARVARQACTADGNLSEGPWEPTSWYAQLEGELKHWESTMPERHKWSTQNLRGMRVKKLDLVSSSVLYFAQQHRHQIAVLLTRVFASQALLSVALNLRLSHIVLARMFLPCVYFTSYTSYRVYKLTWQGPSQTHCRRRRQLARRGFGPSGAPQLLVSDDARNGWTFSRDHRNGRSVFYDSQPA